MKRAAAALAWATLLLGATCGKSTSNSIVVVTVAASPALSPVTRLRVVLTNVLSTDTLFFPKDGPGSAITFDATFAVTLPTSRSGELAIHVDALDGGEDVVGSGSGSVSIEVGGRAETTIALLPHGPADAGMLDSGLDIMPAAADAKSVDVSRQDAVVVDDVARGGTDGSSTRSTGGVGGTGGLTATGGATGTGGAPGSGGMRGTGGQTGPVGSGGVIGSDAGRDSVQGSGGISGTGGATAPRDGAVVASDAPSSCYTTLVSNGYACGSAAPCSACKVGGESKEAECKKGIDCLAAAGPNCNDNCKLNCLNQAGDAQVGACINALTTAACSGSGC